MNVSSPHLVPAGGVFCKTDDMMLSQARRIIRSLIAAYDPDRRLRLGGPRTFGQFSCRDLTPDSARELMWVRLSGVYPGDVGSSSYIFMQESDTVRARKRHVTSELSYNIALLEECMETIIARRPRALA